MNYLRRYRAGIAFVLLTIAVAFALAKVNDLAKAIEVSQANQLVNRVSNVYTWCNGINSSRDYERGFNNSSAKETAVQIKLLRDIINGKNHLTRADVIFARGYLSFITNLEKSPAVRQIHPYIQKDLNCKAIVYQTSISGRKK